MRMEILGLSALAALIPLPTHKQIFLYNKTFGADPQTDNTTVAAWDSLLPAINPYPVLGNKQTVGQSSVRYPPGSQNIYTLSVAHQLHCLWSIHQNYYSAVHGAPDRQGDHIAAHMRHCFDYLRQSLICASDSTLEPVDTKLGGVTGWGSERVCRDYAALSEWAEGRRVSNARGFSGHDTNQGGVGVV
ncbi:hypothetical protein P170DRAFT_461780 [Aspergillus steynii IBT 23096]|uniref:Oxidase ustYa n=1 Tax=Aspergillus steynii IBT 23096 TaxID=1392250 RepID=A0A2I2GFC1_9EURO|nr:uncharacterized protein P170DRAFT_461780 [Aspergillus steynii IBT 23096]PLB51575.1 hypothetical protein P170DRAFT_461780 [Aspergillus steynii IBT 23096]